MNDVINKHQNKPKDIIAVPKKEIFIVLPYLGIQSKIVTQQLRPCIYKFYGCFNPKIIFRNTRRIKSSFPYKDKLNRSLRSKVVYKATLLGLWWLLYWENKTSIEWQENGTLQSADE